MITDRQNLILEKIVRDYIYSAQPVSSEYLEKKYNFGVCPATIRNEMQKLTDNGYLFQPYTSAGRIPTDKGYRYFVDNLKIDELEIGGWFKNDLADMMKFTHSLTKKIAEFSQSLVWTYLGKENLSWKEGWEGLLQEPEFGEKNIIANFTNLLENFEKQITKDSHPQISETEVTVYIGKENPYSKEKDFSIITSRCRLPDEEEVILTLFGPKRMAYDKNIALINSLTKFFEDF